MSDTPTPPDHERSPTDPEHAAAPGSRPEQREHEQPDESQPAADQPPAPASQEAPGESSGPGSTPLGWWRYQRESGREDPPPPRTPPPSKPPVAPPSGPAQSPSAGQPAATPAASSEQSTAERHAAEEQPGAPPDSGLQRSAGRERRGGRDRKRDGSKPKRDIDQPQVPHVVPTPSRRDPLPPELEQEIDAALGDASLEEWFSRADQASGGEGLENESRHRATVIKVHRDSVFFSLGQQYEGFAPLRQFAKPPEEGQQLDVVVKNFQAEEGLYELAVPGASIDVADWSDLSEGSIVEAKITASNAGGLECLVNNIRGFIPISQIALYRVEDLDEFVDQKMQCLVTEVNPDRRNLVLSRRAVLEHEQEESRRRLLEELEVGQTREGIVRNIRDFGAFVDLGGVDGLVHVSQLSWERVQHPSEVLQEGQKVRVKIDKIDRETGKISLSYRDLLEDPWKDAAQRFPAGSILTGTVSRLAKFGAFVKLAAGIEGLIHISELAHYRVRDVAQIVQEGQEVQVKVLSIDTEAQRIALSLKATQQQAEQQSTEEETAGDEPPQELAVPKRQGPLRGGTDRSTGGDRFGLKW